MKRIPAILLLVLNLHSFGQVNIPLLLDSAIAQAKRVSLYSANVNWATLEKEIYSKVSNPKTKEDLKPAFETLLNGLKDFHGSIVNAKDYSTIARFTDYDHLDHPDKRIRDLEISKVINGSSLQFEHKLLSGHVGYLKIVGIAPNIDIEKESKKIRNAVIELSENDIKHWIVDLRYNSGGNMNPMMSGLGPLIGEGIVGKLVNLQGDTLYNWEIKDGNFIYGGSQVVTLKHKPRFNSFPKVAVLTSRWTVSSGEIVATAFKERPNTKFFGEATGGFTTANSWEIINDEIILNISMGIYCDRKGTVYKYNIPVDIEVPFEIIKDQEKDNCIITAKKWLLDQ